jgi:hypothetical protein
VTEPIKLWSVTTLLRLGLGTSDALVNWAVKTTASAAFDRYKILSEFIADDDREGAVKWLTDQRWQKSGAAAARGTNLHAAAESLALGVVPKEVDKIVKPYVEQYGRFLEEFQPEFLMSEAPVYSPTYGYAGTCDGVAIIDGQRVVFDVKTTEHGPDSGRSRPPFSEAALQLVAYRRAEWVGVLSEQRYASGKRYYLFSPDATHARPPETDGAVCIVVSPLDYQVVPVRTDDVVWRAFRHVMEAARWQIETSRSVFGPPISARAKEVAA